MAGERGTCEAWFGGRSRAGGWEEERETPRHIGTTPSGSATRRTSGLAFTPGGPCLAMPSLIRPRPLTRSNPRHEAEERARLSKVSSPERAMAEAENARWALRGVDVGRRSDRGRKEVSGELARRGSERKMDIYVAGTEGARRGSRTVLILPHTTSQRPLFQASLDTLHNFTRIQSTFPRNLYTLGHKVFRQYGTAAGNPHIRAGPSCSLSRTSRSRVLRVVVRRVFCLVP